MIKTNRSQFLVPGVLIEGTDYAGKTTLAKRLVDLLQIEGVACRYQKDYLNNSILVKNLGYVGDHLPLGWLRNLFYNLAIWLDIHFYETRPIFIVQDRHWLSVIAETRLFHSDILLKLASLEHRHIPFRFNVYLTSVAATRSIRFSRNPPVSLMDAYLARDPTVHEEYDHTFSALIPTEENWLVLSTDDLTKEELALRVFSFLQGEHHYASCSPTNV